MRPAQGASLSWRPVASKVLILDVNHPAVSQSMSCLPGGNRDDRRLPRIAAPAAAAVFRCEGHRDGRPTGALELPALAIGGICAGARRRGKRKPAGQKARRPTSPPVVWRDPNQPPTVQHLLTLTQSRSVSVLDRMMEL
mmetsp:Transcript_3157/g.7101  ORF Transcript_3157/g.7101 Transcript_3157/m.7101 type:complete len:139 (-) Transcript_3157:19-435(-)|eukprot:CAMPEP_0204277194 /NCGR_PEP_ID=MMETSP0468-20130131/29156_1 /ASSEMBLY_ACC=CAM_ASM_000383 /TAXON_ID=2969 /ORGANISM="Oxyrrhis marina" /LENGTH=138 /DNA_ID=CAMNT_0051253927 /DNA_START=41 /DNA_END=457 /DNA_ORIENTATION=-